MKIPSLLKVSHARHYVYLDESRGALGVPDTSDQVARSIVEDYIESQLGVDDEARPALFWIPEELKIEQVQEKFKVDIFKRLQIQKKWFLNMVMIADNDWSKYHQLM